MVHGVGSNKRTVFPLLQRILLQSAGSVLAAEERKGRWKVLLSLLLNMLTILRLKLST